MFKPDKELKRLKRMVKMEDQVADKLSLLINHQKEVIEKQLNEIVEQLELLSEYEGFLIDEFEEEAGEREVSFKIEFKTK